MTIKPLNNKYKCPVNCRAFSFNSGISAYLTLVGILLSLIISLPAARASSSTGFEVKSGVLYESINSS